MVNMLRSAHYKPGFPNQVSPFFISSVASSIGFIQKVNTSLVGGFSINISSGPIDDTGLIWFNMNNNGITGITILVGGFNHVEKY